jgi:tetratricopeptide (TPR) repeat protein
VGLKIALIYRALVHYFQTEYEAAEVKSVESAALAREQGDGFHTLAAWMFRGLSRAGQGRLSEALEDFLDAIAAARRNDDRYWLPRLLSRAGWVHRELGALDRARDFDREAVALARERPLWDPEAEALLNLTLDEVRDGRADEGWALVSALQAKAGESTLLKWLIELRVAAASAEHWAMRGDHRRAADHAATLRDIARRVGARDFFCSAARMRAEAALAQGAGLEEAAADLEQALRNLSRGPAPMEVSKSARTLGLIRRRLGDETASRAAFIEAAHSVNAMAAGMRDETLRARYLSMPWVKEVLAAAEGDASRTHP